MRRDIDPHSGSPVAATESRTFPAATSPRFVYLVFALCILTGVPAFLLGQLFASQWEARTLAGEDEAAELEIRATMESIRSVLLEKETALRVLVAAMPRLEDTTVEQLQAYIDRARVASQSLDSLYMGDGSGRPMVFSPAELRGSRDLASMSYADRDYFQALLQTRSASYSRVQMGKTTRVPNVHVAVPILADSGELQAYITGGVQLSVFEKVVLASHTRGVGRTLIVDDHGRVVIDTDGLLAPLSKISGSVADLVLHGATPRTIEGSNPEGERVRITGLELKLRNIAWRVLSLTPRAHIDAQVGQVRRQARDISLAAVFASILVSTLVSWWLTQALRTITQRSQQLALDRDRASKTKTEFLAHMSHEIRTPLNAVLGFAQLLARDPTLTEGQSGQVHTILRSGQHLHGLVNSVLELSKIEAGEVELQLQPFDLKGMVNEVAALFRVRAAERGNRLVLEVADSVPRSVLCDGGKVRQVLTNLVGNAVTFTENGVITLRVGYRADPVVEGRGRLSIAIQDEGVGIPADQLDRVFLSFQQSEVGTQRGGTGLGLAISDQFVRLMGGTLEVQSVLGQGSTFSLELEVLENPSATGDTSDDAAFQSLRPDSPVRRLLVVDDGPENRAVLRGLLEPLGFQVEDARNGSEALRSIADAPPDAMLLDLRMPDMSGYEVLQALRSDGARVGFPVLVVTASAFEAEAQRARDAGVQAFLRKPVAADELYRALSGVGARFHQMEKPVQLDDTAVLKGLRELDEGVRQTLHESVEDGDMARFRSLVASSLRDTKDSALREALLEQATHYRYEQLMAWLAA